MLDSRFSVRCFRPLSEIEPSRTVWLWPGVIPSGKLTLFVGDPGVGQTLVACDIAARVSRDTGWPVCPVPEDLLPAPSPDPAPEPEAQPLADPARDNPADDEHTGAPFSDEYTDPDTWPRDDDRFDPSVDTLRPRPPANPGPALTLFLSPEETSVEALIPRLIAAGADVDCIDTPDALATADDLPFSHETLADLAYSYTLAQPGAGLIIIDPLEFDPKSPADVARTLRRLSELADRAGIAVIALVRAPSRLALSRLPILSLCHNIWRIERDHNEHGRFLVPLKTNFGPDTKALRFHIHSRGVTWDPEPVDAATINARPTAPNPAQTAVARALAFLMQALANGARPAAEVERLAANAGIHPRTLRRAKVCLAVASAKAGDVWLWSLTPPGTNEPAPA